MSSTPAGAGTGFNIDAVLHPDVNRRLRDLPGLVGRALGLVWRAAPRELVVVTFLQMVAGAMLAVQLLAGRRLLGHLLQARTGHDFGSTAPDVIVLSLALGLAALANLVRGEMQRTLAELVGRHSLEQVLAVSARVDLLMFESTGFHDRMQRAIVNASGRPLQLTTGLLSLASSLLAAAALAATLIVLQPLVVLLAVAAIVPVYAATVNASRALYRFSADQAPTDRQRFYLQYLLTDKASAQEVRALDSAEFLEDRYDSLYSARIAALRRVVSVRIRRGVAGASLTALITGASIGLLIWFVASGRLSLAGAGAATAGLILLGGQLQGLASGAGLLYESSLFVEDLTSFVGDAAAMGVTRRVAVRPRAAAETGPTDTLPPHITAEAVGFTYPNRPGMPALLDVSLDIRPGQVVALVGENGSGKTTLAKILAGLYPPTSGVVRWNGKPLDQLDPNWLRDRTTVLFQDFVRYQMAAADNVGLGRWAWSHDRERIEAAARRSGAGFLRTLPAGLDTYLGPHFYGGVELSGGQWQRVAMARALLRDTPFVILDEPTAALDPRAESEMFEALRDLLAGRSVLLISHRFGSVRLADRIYVLSEGRLLESGNHAELMDLDGWYAEMFRTQSAAYDLSV